MKYPEIDLMQNAIQFNRYSIDYLNFKLIMR
jgi:hypothetical protein